MAELDFQAPPQKRERKKYNHALYLKCKTQVQKRTSEYASTHREIYRGYSKKHYAKSRIPLILSMGAECKNCRFNDIRALQIDHINGDGASERKEQRGSRLYTSMFKLFKENSKEFAKRYQLLCANCNWIKRHEKNEFRKS